MREIKFRAWDKETEKMLMPDSNSDGEHIWQFNGNGDIVILAEGTKWKEGGGETYEETGFYPIDCALMQFTGLTDKNGKEIFEGDVLSNIVARWVVVFNRGCFCHQMVGRPQNPTELALRSLVGGEIIGNIYENPELLK